MNPIRRWLWRRRWCRSRWIGAWALCLAPVVGVAEEPTGSPWDRIVQVQFAGGTVEEYVAQLRRQEPHANVVVTGDAATFRLPPIELQNVTVLAAYDCLGPASEGVVEVTDDLGIDIFVLRRNASQQPQVAVSHVGHLLNHYGEADLLSAIEIGLKMLQGTVPQVELKLHQETGLLFTKGTRQEIDLIDGIVREIARGLPAGETTPAPD